MTRIDFYVNVPDKLGHMAGLVQQALSRKRRLLVYTTDAEAAARIEHALWTQPPTGFLPHCRSHHPLAGETPIVIDWQGQSLAHDDVLINLTPEHPPFFSRFRGLIEIVGEDEEDKAQARARFRFYRDRGYEIRHHDLAGT